MGKIGSISSGNHYAPINSGVSVDKQNNKLYQEKLTFKPAELKLGNRRPTTIELSERQIETKLFQKHGFSPNNPTQMETLKLRLDTRQSPYSEINWGKGKFVAKLNAEGQYEITVGLRGRTVEALQGRPIPATTESGASGVNPNDAVAAKRIIDDSSQRADLQAKADAASTAGLTPEQKELVLDLTQVGLSVVGIFDPTGVADGADAVVSLGRGDYWGAGISALGIIPYLGDLAKIGKLPKLLKIVDNVVSMAKTDAKFAKVVTPLLSKLKGALDSLPIHKLPNWAKEPIQSMKNKIDEFFSKGANKTPNGVEPPKKPSDIDKQKKIDEIKKQRAETEAQRKLQEGIREAEAKGKIKNLPEADRKWLESDPRHKELAYDPDQKNFNVKEAKAATEAEKQGLLKPPVKRAIDEYGSSRGGDYIDAAGKYWDVKDASAGADKIIDVLAQGENVLVDASKLTKTELDALVKSVNARIPKNGAEVKFLR